MFLLPLASNILLIPRSILQAQLLDHFLFSISQLAWILFLINQANVDGNLAYISWPMIFVWPCIYRALQFPISIFQFILCAIKKQFANEALFSAGYQNVPLIVHLNRIIDSGSYCIAVILAISLLFTTVTTFTIWNYLFWILFPILSGITLEMFFLTPVIHGLYYYLGGRTSLFCMYRDALLPQKVSTSALTFAVLRFAPGSLNLFVFSILPILLPSNAAIYFTPDYASGKNGIIAVSSILSLFLLIMGILILFDSVYLLYKYSSNSLQVGYFGLMLSLILFSATATLTWATSVTALALEDPVTTLGATVFDPSRGYIPSPPPSSTWILTVSIPYLILTFSYLILSSILVMLIIPKSARAFVALAKQFRKQKIVAKIGREKPLWLLRVNGSLYRRLSARELIEVTSQSSSMKLIEMREMQSPSRMKRVHSDDVKYDTVGSVKELVGSRCRICLSSSADSIFWPCGHTACGECGELLMKPLQLQLQEESGLMLRLGIHDSNQSAHLPRESLGTDDLLFTDSSQLPVDLLCSPRLQLIDYDNCLPNCHLCRSKIGRVFEVDNLYSINCGNGVSIVAKIK
jgi:Zinc finger, C3HC4 type (RING finger)